MAETPRASASALASWAPSCFSRSIRPRRVRGSKGFVEDVMFDF
jgi:hypothetical protein